MQLQKQYDKKFFLYFKISSTMVLKRDPNILIYHFEQEVYKKNLFLNLNVIY